MKVEDTNYIAGDVVIKPNVTIGRFNNIASGVFFHCDSEHPCIRDPNIVTSQSFNNAFIWTAFPKQMDQDPIVIENDVWIAKEARILEGATLSNGCIVGAYSVVTKFVPPYAIVAGNPARIIRFRFDEDTINKLQKIQWWNWGFRTVRHRLKDFMDIHTFIQKYG